jgi:hypothetical protein
MNEKELLKEIHANCIETTDLYCKEIDLTEHTIGRATEAQYILEIFEKHNYKPEDANE